MNTFILSCGFLFFIAKKHPKSLQDKSSCIAGLTGYIQ